jgi:hypothetical protein
MRRAAAALLLLTGACGGPADEQAAETDGPAPAEGVIPAPHDHGNFLLASGGLQVLDQQGEPRLLPFGAPRGEVERAAAGVFGEAAAERAANAECGAGPMEFTSWEPLTFNFQDGRFVGWTIEHPGDVPTVDGASTGLSRAKLEQAHDVRPLEGSTLGEEFAYVTPDGGTIGGIFDGEGEDAIVALLYAGTTCFFR